MSGSPLWPNPHPHMREQYMEMFKRQMKEDPEFNAMNFEINRTDRKNLFPSQEAMEGLWDQTIAFVAAAMMSQYERTGKTPKTLRVKLEVEQEI